MQTIAIDSGRYTLKTVTGEQKLCIPSVVGEWRELHLNSGGDYEVRIDGSDYFIGELAARESRFRRENVSRTKVHEETKLLTLTAAGLLAQESKLRIVTGLPVEQYNQETKKAYQKLLLGPHTVQINGKSSKEINICEVIVSIEGAGAYWWEFFKYNEQLTKQNVKILDIGSRTINALSINSGRYSDLDSFTLNYGCIELMGYDNLKEQFVRRIIADVARRWLAIEKDILLLTGGGALLLESCLKAYYKNALLVHDTVFASALGLHEMGIRL